ncbi:MAG: CRISPR-associated endonuclease Cas1 [Azospirillaceae bacterium]|nr:CRISPR-associated endonuclease Cas1 [Azospirillaceae bacterium]
MSSLYVDRRGVEIGIDSEALTFHENGVRVGTVPIAPLERVYLRGDIRLATGTLGRLGAHGVGVIILSGRRAEPTLFLPRPHHDARLRVTQLRWEGNPARRLEVAGWVLKAKLLAHQALLAELAEARPELRGPLLHAAEILDGMHRHIASKPDTDALRGLEGAAAAAYFGALVSIFPQALGFTGRNRRPPRDPVNAVLSLGYTMLNAEAVLTTHGHGFDPYVGFLHALDFARPSLACDVMEPLRPVIDRFAWRLFAEQTVRARDFSTEKDGSCLLGKAGRERFYQAVDEPLTRARKRLDALLSALRSVLLEAEDGRALPDQL